jgi:hypothetical protein
LAFPTTGTLDDFNRADGALGANWTGGFFADSSNLTIVSNAAKSAGAAFGGSSWNTQKGADLEIWGILQTTLAGGSTTELWLEPLDSQSSGSPNGFGLVAAGTGSANKGLRLFRFDAGTPSAALIQDTTITWAAGDGFGFSRVGTTFTMYRLPSGGAWAQVSTTATDSNYATALFLGAESSSNSPEAAFDTFGGGTLGSNTPPFDQHTGGYARFPKTRMRR